MTALSLPVGALQVASQLVSDFPAWVAGWQVAELVLAFWVHCDGWPVWGQVRAG